MSDFFEDIARLFKPVQLLDMQNLTDTTAIQKAIYHLKGYHTRLCCEAQWADQKDKQQIIDEAKDVLDTITAIETIKISPVTNQ